MGVVFDAPNILSLYGKSNKNLSWFQTNEKKNNSSVFTDLSKRNRKRMKTIRNRENE